MILTTAEYNAKRNQLLKTYTEAWFSDMSSQVWLSAPRGISKCNAKLLWLFVFTLNTYTHSDSATNYVSENDIMNIFAKVNTIQ